MAQLIAHDRILQLHAVAIAAGLVMDRGALLTGIDRHLVALLPAAHSPGGQLLLDLDSLNRVEVAIDDDLPLGTWIHNALALLGPKRDATSVRTVMEALRALKKTLMYHFAMGAICHV